MKKYILSAGIAALLGAGAAQASMEKGFYTGLRLGYANTGGEFADQPVYMTAPATKAQGNKKHGSIFAALSVGHGMTCGKGYFGGEVSVSYDASKSQIMKVNDVAAAAAAAGGVAAVVGSNGVTVLYKPRFGIGIAAKGGVFFTPTVLGFVRFGIDYNFAQVVYTPSAAVTAAGAANQYKDWAGQTNCKTWSIVPGIGVQGALNDKFSWIAGVHYKIPVSAKINDNGAKFNKKPTAVIATVGVTYYI